MRFRGQRLASARHEAGYHSAEAFGAAIGVSGQAVRTWEAEKHAPSEDNLARIVEVTGKPVGYFYGEEDAEIADVVRRLEALLGAGSAQTIGELVAIPLYETASAGGGAFADERPAEFRHLPITWLPPGQSTDTCFFVRASGDSMVGVGIAEGDLLLVCTAVPVRHGNIAVVRLGDEVVVKRVQELDGALLLVSENPAYPPRRVTDAEVIGRVMWWRHDAS